MFSENTSKILLLFLAAIKLTGSLVTLPDEDANRNTTELIASKGYPVVEYTVKTKDHYIIAMQRIPAGREGVQQWPKGGKPVAFLMTGLECSSADFVVNLPHQSLGFILADHGFDVWLGNVRGTQYSSHEWLSKENKDFWDFSIDEMAAYDLPAQLDWVLKTTQQSSLQYVGWSQGCAILFALLAERPEYNRKIQLFHAIAPAVFLGHMTSPMKRLEPISKPIYEVGQIVLGGSLLGKHLNFVQTMKQLSCNPVIPSISCTAAFLFVNRGYPVDINMTRLPVYMGNTPSGTSMRNLLHYAQLTKSKSFQKFDWGPKKNWKVYKKLLPPKYNLKKVTAPVAIYWGDGDVFVTPRDVARLARRLPNVVLNYKVPLHGFTHFDVAWSITACKHLYKKILEMMIKYTNSALAGYSATEQSNG
uniref:Lipase n=1 Tax=Rhipicephalus zambeziensis TaxID=60191 RepID=A0A224Z3L9_9ACAR